MKKLIYSLSLLFSLCSSAFAALSTQGWNYYEKPGEKPISTSYTIYTSSRIIFTGNGGIQWADGQVSTSPVSSGGGAVWGSISGTIGDQADLASLLGNYQLNLTTVSWRAFAATTAYGMGSGDYLNDVKVSSAIYANTAGSAASATTATTATNLDSNTVATYEKIRVGTATISDTATNALNLGGVVAANYSQTSHNHTGTYQPADDDLTDLADGSLTGSKVGSGILAANIAAGTNEGVRVGTATISDTATNALNLGGVAASGYSQTSHNHTGTYQPADADLDDLADGSLTGSKVGSGIPVANLAEGANETVRVGTATIALSCSGNAATVTNGLYTTSTADVQTLKVGTATVADSASSVAAANVQSGSLGASVLVSSVAVNAVRRESLKDVNLDSTIPVMGSTTTISTNAIRISPFFDSAITISTITVSVIGGTSVTGMIEQRTKAGQGSAGTDIWSGDITANTTYIGGTVSDFTVPAGSALFFVPTSWVGAVNNVEITGAGVRD